MIRAVLIVCFAVLLLSGRAGAQQTVELRPDSQHVEIYKNIWFLLDETGALTLDQVRAAPEKFQRNTRGALNFGDPGPVIWLRLDVANIGGRDGEWLFATRRNFLSIFDVYLVRRDRTELLFTATDQKSVLDSNKRLDMLAPRFDLAAGERAVLFARYRGVNDSRMPVTISSLEAVAKVRQDKYVIFYIIAASVAALILYSTAIFLIIGGRALLYYAAAEIALLLIVAQANGILNTHLWPEIPTLHRLAPGIINTLNVIFASLFTRHFFHLRQRAPRTDLLFLILIGSAMVYLTLTALIYQQQQLFNLHMLISYLMLSVIWTALPLLAVIATIYWDRNFWPLIPAWLIVAFGHYYWIILFIGMVSEPPFDPELIGFISVGHAFFLAVAIVLQVRRLRDEKLHAQLDLNAALQRQLAAANQNAEILRELAAQDRLVHAAGHDSRSILLGLRSFAAGLQGGTNTAQIGAAAQAITHLTDDLEAVLSTTIASAAHSGGENVLALESAPLKQIVAAVRLIHERAIRDKGLRFSVYPGEHELVTDRPLLARILGNLVENALKFTETGGIVVAARRHGGGLRIQVWDSGCGIAPELLTALLDVRIGKMRVSGSAAGQGTGLYTVKALAARIGAKISACSRPGHGSVFELRLPLKPEMGMRHEAGEQRLWVLENMYETALNYAGMAEELGLTAKCMLPSMQEALFERSGLRNKDLVLIDYNFGGVNNGLQMAKRLATLIPPANIFLKTYDRGVDVRAAVSGNAGVILYEPVTLEALRMAIYSPKPSTSAIE